jgi:hypothetical protein
MYPIILQNGGGKIRSPLVFLKKFAERYQGWNGDSVDKIHRKSIDLG